MPTCVEGHSSKAADYCDVCGAPIGSAAAQPDSPASVEAKACPACGMPVSGRCCEACGHAAVENRVSQAEFCCRRCSHTAHADEAGWVFSANTCIDFLSRLHRHHADERYVDRCVKAAQWTFRECQFDDGAVGWFEGGGIGTCADVAG